MMFKPGQFAKQRWCKHREFADLAKVIKGVRFANGEEVEQLDQVAV